KKDWSRLRLAKKFVTERCQAAGFTQWRAERRFLLDMAEIGVMASLVQPEGDGGTDVANPAILSNGSISDDITGEQVRESSSGDPRDYANVRIGLALGSQSEVRWTLDQTVDPKLPNFGMLVSGGAGQGKTQLIKALIAEAAALGCPILIFDFKNDYGG